MLPDCNGQKLVLYVDHNKNGAQFKMSDHFETFIYIYMYMEKVPDLFPDFSIPHMFKTNIKKIYFHSHNMNI